MRLHIFYKNVFRGIFLNCSLQKSIYLHICKFKFLIVQLDEFKVKILIKVILEKVYSWENIVMWTRWRLIL